MKTQAVNIVLRYTGKMKPEICLELASNAGLDQIDDLMAHIAKGKTLDLEIKPHRERRSLDANAFCWVMMTRIAGVLRTTAEEVYLTMLERYGQSTYVIVKNEAVEMMKKEWRTLKEVGKTRDGTGTQLLCFFGSSTYDTKQFSIFLDGIISDAKELGIETATESERELMLAERK